MDLLTLIAVVLLVLWATGNFALHLGGAVHVLLVVALVLIVVRLLRGERVLPP